MSEQIFRKKSLERVTSPEDLNAYIQVSSPGIWMVLTAIVLLLAGVCVWGVVGHLDTTITVAAVAENGTVTAYIHEADAARVEEGMPVEVGGKNCTLGTVEAKPVVVDASFDEYTRHVGALQSGEWVFPAAVNAALEDGVYSAEIVVESVSPMSFVLN